MFSRVHHDCLYYKTELCVLRAERGVWLVKRTFSEIIRDWILFPESKYQTDIQYPELLWDRRIFNDYTLSDLQKNKKELKAQRENTNKKNRHWTAKETPGTSFLYHVHVEVCILLSKAFIYSHTWKQISK